MESQRPKTAEETAEPVYSNVNHELDEAVKSQLQVNPNILYAQHSAWNFCGYIWYDGNKWKEEVWQYKSPVALEKHYTIEELIDEVNDIYGSD